jgi:MFS family permease
MLPVLVALFVLSGAAGLMYESIWTRYLGLFVGHGAYAQLLVLVIFLGGMSLGAHVVGRRSERLREPLLWYAGVELVVGVIGLAFHPLFAAVTGGAYDALFPALPGAGAVLVAKWTIAALLILPQSVLLGATFPLMSAGALRRTPGAPGRTLALLYFSNSLGAAAGVLVAGFVLLAAVGLPGTLAAAAVCNVAVALGAYAVARAEPEGRGGEAPAPAVAATASTAAARGGAPRALVRTLLAGRLRHGGGVVRLRDRVDPHALARRRQRHPLVRAHAERLHPGPRARRLVGAPPRRRLGRPDPRPRPHPVGDGHARRGHAAGVPVELPRDGVAARRHRPHRGRVPPVRLRALPAVPGRDAARHVLRRRHAAAHHPRAPRARRRRARGGPVYAVNTLGSIVGAALAGLVLMPLVGLRWLLVIGALLDAALGVWLLARHATVTAGDAPAPEPRAHPPVVGRRWAGEPTASADARALVPVAAVGTAILVVLAGAAPFDPRCSRAASTATGAWPTRARSRCRSTPTGARPR